MLVKAYHSAHPADQQVYHDDDECPAGRDIPWWNRRPGADDLPHCPQCIETAERHTALSA